MLWKTSHEVQDLLHCTSYPRIQTCIARSSFTLCTRDVSKKYILSSVPRNNSAEAEIDFTNSSFSNPSSKCSRRHTHLISSLIHIRTTSPSPTTTVSSPSAHSFIHIHSSSSSHLPQPKASSHTSTISRPCPTTAH